MKRHFDNPPNFPLSPYASPFPLNPIRAKSFVFMLRIFLTFSVLINQALSSAAPSSSQHGTHSVNGSAVSVDHIAPRSTMDNVDAEDQGNEDDMTKAILEELQREGLNTHKKITPSKKFMIDLFSSLRREEILQNNSKEQLTETSNIHHSDTVRSFSAKVPSSSSSRHKRRNRLFYEFYIPVLPEHEETHVVEFRVLISNSRLDQSKLMLAAAASDGQSRSHSIIRRSWAVVVKQNGKRIYKGTRKYQPVEDGPYDVFDVTEPVASYLNENKGNLVIVIKERSRSENDDDDEDDPDYSRAYSEQNVCASPGNGLLVLYSRNSQFFRDIYQRYTSVVASPISNEQRRGRRHSENNGAQNRRQRTNARENERNKNSNDEEKKRTKESGKKKKIKKTKKKKQKKMVEKSSQIPCGRYNFMVDFDIIGWSKWIVAPKKFNAYLCSGSCAFHDQAKHNSSTHAMLQSLMRLKQPDVSPMPCCVPTKLQSISMMYFELGEIVVRKHQDVIAKECGCR